MGAYPSGSCTEATGAALVLTALTTDLRDSQYGVTYPVLFSLPGTTVGLLALQLLQLAYNCAARRCR